MGNSTVRLELETKPAGAEHLELTLPDCESGIGKLVHGPDSPGLIDGVKIQPYALWPDDRGYFLEVIRLGFGLAAHFPVASTQVATALSYPGAIKAFHYHRHQTDLWVPSVGMFQIGLVDLRKNSPTFGARNTLYAGALRPCQVLIPPGVGHGYKVIGDHPGVLTYVTDRFYNPKDEGRIPYNEPHINYDWEIQHK
jgi:dTDP-4-dehydrorhamnose 3,5-epimerase